MNKNLLKVLALSTLVLTIGACTKKGDGPGPETDDTVELTLAEMFDIQGGKYVNEGKKVRVKDLQVYTEYEGKLLVGFGNAGGTYTTDNLKGFEVEPTEMPQWTTDRKAHNADVTVTGTFTDFHGRPVLTDATVEVIAEGENSKYSTGVPYMSGEMTRDTWNEEMGKSHNGVSIEGIWQLASVPNPVSATESAEFSVVFTGENTDGEDPSNEYLIHAYIPSGLPDSVISFYNTLFEGAQVGDFYFLSPYTLYDNTLGGMGILFEDGVSANSAYTYRVPEKDWPVILKNFSEIKDQFDELFKNPLPSIGCEAEGTFSYLIDDLFGYDVGKIFKDPSQFLFFENLKKVGTVGITFNCGMMKTDVVFEAIGTKAIADGYELDTTLSSSEKAVYVKTVAEKVVGELLVGYSEDAKSILVYYFGIRATDEEVGNFAAAVTLLDEKAGEKIGDDTFASDLPGLGSYDASVESAELSWQNINLFDEAGCVTYMITPEFADGTFADDEAWEDFIEEYSASLRTYADGKDWAFVTIGQGPIEGFFNEEKRTIVFIDVETDDDAHIIGITVYVCVAKTSDQALKGVSVFDISDESKWTKAGTLNYLFASLNWLWSVSSREGNTDEFVKKGASAITSTHYLSATFLDNIIEYALPKCVTEGEQEVVIKGNTHYYFTLPSETAGKLVQIDIATTPEPSDDEYCAFTLTVTEINEPTE
jgi:hypothetical protein